MGTAKEEAVRRMWCPYCQGMQTWKLKQSEGTPAKYVCQGCLERIRVSGA